MKNFIIGLIELIIIVLFLIALVAVYWLGYAATGQA
jgi:hypothetical protein